MNRILKYSTLGILLLFYTSTTFAIAEKAFVPPTNFQAYDTPNDNGKSVSLRWPVSPSDSFDNDYIIYMSTSSNGPFNYEALRFKSNTMPDITDANYHYVEIKPDKVLEKTIVDRKRGDTYFFKLAISSGLSITTFKMVTSATPKGNWFNKSKINNFVIMIMFSALVFYYISHAKKNPNMFLRKISGLDAIDDALGRATEMGKPALFVHGLTGMGSISTIASVNILGRIAKRVAEYDMALKVANIDPIVLVVSQEVVKESYLEAGRPDAYNDDNVFLAASEQFPYVAAVSGIMIREKPAANFFMGYFYAESLILAETGANTGAIQIAATDSYTQLPFFITTCDYTLIGEELYAASAYLSREPLLLGSLRAQDITKAILLAAIVIGTIFETFGIGIISYIFNAR